MTEKEQASPGHSRTWNLIPWLVNGTATAEERALAEEHLRACADCRDEYAFQSLLRAGIGEGAAAEEPEDDAAARQASLQRLLNRIDAAAPDQADAPGPGRAAAPPARALRPRPADRSRRSYRLVALALAGQSAALALLGALLFLRAPSPAQDAPYRTLSRSAGPAATATIRFVPAPGLTLGAMQALLAEAKLHVVESNDDGSIYGLAPLPAKAAGAADSREAATARAIARLRAQRGVLLAEPIGAPVGHAR